MNASWSRRGDRIASRATGGVTGRVASRIAGRVAALGTLLVVLAACDSGPSGPGFVGGSVVANGEAPASALLVVNGRGVIDVEGTGETLGWSDATGDNEIRALLVDSGSGGALTFRVQVEDVGAPLPQIAVLQLADHENRRFSTTDIQIRMRR